VVAAPGRSSALHRHKMLCLPQKPVYHPIHITVIRSRLAHLRNGPGAPCRGGEDFFAFLLQSGETDLCRGEVRTDRNVMLQRRQQCEAICTESIPALKAYCLVSSLTEVADMEISPMATRTLT